MDLDSLFCGICYNNYDQTEKIPRIISNCGHTVCVECLNKILQINPNSQMNQPSQERPIQHRRSPVLELSSDDEDENDASEGEHSYESSFIEDPVYRDPSSMRCPFDKIQISRDPLQHPVNYALMHLLEDKNQSSEGCRIHRQRLRYVCLCNKTKVCHDCIILGAHKGHEAKLLTDIAEEAELKQKKVEESIKLYEQHHNEINKVIEDKKTCLLKGMKEKFTSIRSVLDSKEFEISARINALLRTEQKRIEEQLHISPRLESDLEAKSQAYKIRIQLQQYHSVLDDDISLLRSQVDGTLLSKRLASYDQELKNIPDYGELFFNSLQPVTSKIDSSVDLIITDNFVKNKKLKTKSSHETKEHTNWIEFNSSLSFRLTNKTLLVSTTEKTPSATLVNLEDWNELNKVKLELAHYNITTKEENLKVLDYVCNWARKIPRFEIVFEPTGLSNDFLSDLLPVLLKRPEEIINLQICLEHCRISQESLIHLFEKFISQMTNLNSLELNLGSTFVTNKCLGVLSEKVLRSIQELRSFALDLSDVYGVTDQGVISIMIDMESVTSYYLHLQNTQISDDTLNAFADSTLQSMKSLKNLTLCLGATKIGDGSAMTLFNKLNHNLHSLTVDLEGTNVTDQSVSIFLTNFSRFSKALKKLDVSFDDSYATTKYTKKLNKIRKCYSSNQAE